MTTCLVMLEQDPQRGGVSQRDCKVASASRSDVVIVQIEMAQRDCTSSAWPGDPGRTNRNPGIVLFPASALRKVLKHGSDDQP